ncbi:MAG: Rho termination factor N-terminal domain-containing protein, partial [Clostridiales bacterium]|nr:Rho termination factor N-terminal domain-containing protein [Clostridiales bacterium]
MTTEELMKKSILELRVIAKENGVKKSTTYKKGELISKLLEALEEKKEVPAQRAATPRTTQRAAASRTTAQKTATTKTTTPRTTTRRTAAKRETPAPSDENIASSLADATAPPLSAPRLPRRNTTQRETPAQPSATPRETPAPRENFTPRESFTPRDTMPRVRTDTVEVSGILDVCEDGFGFVRCENYLS